MIGYVILRVGETAVELTGWGILVILVFAMLNGRGED